MTAKQISTILLLLFVPLIQAVLSSTMDTIIPRIELLACLAWCTLIIRNYRMMVITVFVGGVFVELFTLSTLGIFALSFFVSVAVVYVLHRFVSVLQNRQFSIAVLGITVFTLMHSIFNVQVTFSLLGLVINILLALFVLMLLQNFLENENVYKGFK